MKINNQSIKGLFKYEAGFTYEEGDLVYYNGLIYYVNTGFNSTAWGSDNKNVITQMD